MLDPGNPYRMLVSDKSRRQKQRTADWQLMPDANRPEGPIMRRHALDRRLMSDQRLISRARLQA